MSTNEVRYSDEELDEFKKLVEDKLAEAREQLELIKDQYGSLLDSPESKIQSINDGIPPVETAKLISQAERIEKHIVHLEKALLRIENKTYGICRETGKLISKARLRAVPHATLSIEAKSKQ